MGFFAEQFACVLRAADLRWIVFDLKNFPMP